MADSDSVSDESASKNSDVTRVASSAQTENNSFVPLIFGGAVACALGFFGAQLDGVERALGLGPEDNVLEALVAEQGTTLRAQAELIQDLQMQLEAIPPAPDPVDLSGLETGLSDQAASLADAVARLSALEKRPMTEGVSEEAIAAYEAELTRLQGTVETQRTEVEALLADARNTETLAERNAQLALARAAMTRIVAAVDSGAPFTEALSDLASASDATVPETLSALAGDGVPTLANVQDAFPDAARAALAAARSEDATAGSVGLGGFLQRQLGARSTTPQEGDDPDAVLSRAEAAVREGRIGDALAEVETLPDVAQATMADWISLAGTRNDATAAADELMISISAN